MRLQFPVDPRPRRRGHEDEHALPGLTVDGAIRLPVFEPPHDFRWVSNRRLVIARGMELGSRERPVSTGELLAEDIDGTHQEYLHGYRMVVVLAR